MKFIPETRHPH